MISDSRNAPRRAGQITGAQFARVRFNAVALSFALLNLPLPHFSLAAGAETLFTFYFLLCPFHSPWRASSRANYNPPVYHGMLHGSESRTTHSIWGRDETHRTGRARGSGSFFVHYWSWSWHRHSGHESGHIPRVGCRPVRGDCCVAGYRLSHSGRRTDIRSGGMVL